MIDERTLEEYEHTASTALDDDALAKCPGFKPARSHIRHSAKTILTLVKEVHELTAALATLDESCRADARRDTWHPKACGHCGSYDLSVSENEPIKCGKCDAVRTV